MKLFLLAFGLLMTTFSFAGNADLFKIDRTELDKTFSTVNQLEDYAIYNHVNLKEVQFTKEGLVLAANLNIDATKSLSSSLEPPLGIPSFVWGFCFGPIGVAITLFVADDNEETKLAMYGCLAGTVVSLFLQLVLLSATI